MIHSIRHSTVGLAARAEQRTSWAQCCSRRLRSVSLALSASLVSALLSLCLPSIATAQVKAMGGGTKAALVGAPALGTPGVNCVISAVNRNAIVETDASYTIFNIPALTGAFRGRVTCSDGSVGQTAVKFSSVSGGQTIELGDIVWGKIDPVPTALGLTAPEKRLTTSGVSQLNASAIGINPDNSATTYNVTPRSAGTTYTISNDLLGTVSVDGQVKILAGFASGSSSRVVLSASTEGGATGSYVYFVGPRGSLSGRVVGADGVTPVVGAQVTVLRTQPREQVGTATTDASGNFSLPDVNAGPLQLTAIDPSNGDRALANARIETEGEAHSVNLRMNGQGTVDVTVVSVTGVAPNEVLTPVPNSQVTLTALGAYLDTRTSQTNANGVISFARVAAGDFTVSTRDRASGLVGTALGLLAAGTTTPVVLRLQPVGTITGVVYDVNGTTPRADIQVRVISRERGIVTQGLTDANGVFSFAPLPLSDGPFTLDAFADGRLRARVPGLVLNQANQVLTQNITLSGVGTVRGTVLDENRQPAANALVTLQLTDGQRFAYNATTDASGQFWLPAVLLGNYVITAGKDAKTGKLTGRLTADGESQVVEIQLGGATVTGIVYERDATTPVGAGTRVYLVPSGKETLTIDPVLAGAVSATTDAQGRYVLTIPTLGKFTIQAERADDRGRAELAVATLNPAQPFVANLVFLGKGTVTGVVKDPAGVVQGNVAVTLKSSGTFVNTWTTTTDAAGRYSLTGVFVGELLASARNSQTQLAGFATGRMVTEAQALVMDITLAATGTIQGQVRKRNGTVVPADVQLELRLGGAGGTVLATQFLGNGSAYQFGLVPASVQVSVVAIELATGDKGVATTQIDTSNQTKALNVQMIGQGTVKVRTVAALPAPAGSPIANAEVVLTTTMPIYAQIKGYSDANGEVVLSPVFAGDYSVTASIPQQVGILSGTEVGTVIADSQQLTVVKLNLRPTGTIKGVVYKPDGVTPQPDVLVRMTPEPSFGVYTRQTDAQGRYQFDNIEGGNGYTLQVRRYESFGCGRDRIRAQAVGVDVATQDEVVVRNLTIFPAGRVHGKLTDLAGVAVPGLKVSLTNADPTYGSNTSCATSTRFESVSDPNGDYILEDIPGGNFTVIADNADQSKRAEAAGRVRFDADDVTLNMIVVDSAVAMPQLLHDANAIPFDIQGDGSVARGKNNVFTGTGVEAGGMQLAIVTNSIPVPFTNGNGSVGRLTQSGQQIEVDEDNASGLKVTRKIWVPRTGYFARYLEILENKTASPITVSVKVVSNHSQGDSNPRVVDSSDGDQVLSVSDANNRDRWVIIDDQQDADPFVTGTLPATGHIFDGAPTNSPNAPAIKSVSIADYQLIGQAGRLTWQWSDVTVAPGAKVAFMHFAFSQLDRYRARQSAIRLSALPPEVLENLPSEERAAIANFALPAIGTDSAPKLPSVDVAVVSGTVVSGDGTTPIPAAVAHFKSASPYYGRDYYVNADAFGRYEFRANTDGTANAVAVSLEPFGADALHPKTGASTGLSQSDFVAPQTTVIKNLVFNNTGNIRGVVRRHNGALVAGADVVQCAPADQAPCGNPSNFDKTLSNGTYLLAASRPGDYSLHAQVLHPQQAGGMPMLGRATGTATAGDTAVVNVTMEETGSLAGLVRAANGDPLQNAVVKLSFVSPQGTYLARTTTTDTAGRYRFFDVRVGGVAVEVKDRLSQAIGRGTSVVVVDVETTLDITLGAFGTLAVQVNFARGSPAGITQVYYESTVNTDSGYGETDSNGRVNFNVAVGSYRVSAWHPDDPSNAALKSTVTATVATQASVVDVVVGLPAAGAVKGQVLRPDGSTLAGGFPYTIKPVNSSRVVTPQSIRTDAVGNYRFSALPVGQWIITAYDAEQNRFADDVFFIAQDGQEVTVNLNLEDNRIALPAVLRDANRFPFDVQPTGEVATGLTSVANAFAGAGRLEINGTAFTGDTSALLEAQKRQFAITQPAALAGLTVTRKVFVPYGAYFARYLEVLENKSSIPVTVDVTLKHGLPSSSIVHSTSSGDAMFAANDRWLIVDDAADGDPLLAPQQATTAFLLHGVGGAVLPDAASFVDSASVSDKQATMQWSSLTVPANGKTVLMHFAVQQINRTGAFAAVERLATLPPEALASLTESEVLSIRNFNVPANGESTVTPLPRLTGGLNGRVLEGDGRTPVVGVHVTVQSSHPLFNRLWGMQPDPTVTCAVIPGTSLPFQVGNNNIGSVSSGAFPNATPPVLAGTYAMNGQLTAEDSVVMPEGAPVTIRAQQADICFGYYAGHSWTRIPSKTYVTSPTVVQNVVFDSGVLTGAVTGYNDFSVTTGRLYLSVDNPESPDFHFVPIESDGKYVYPGLPPGTYDLLVDTTHPQSTFSDLRGSRTNTSTILGEVTVTDVRLQPAGSVVGAVVTANGEATVDAVVEIFGAATGQTYDQCAADCVAATRSQHKGKRDVRRSTRTDSLGRFNFAALPIGNYSLSVTDPVSGGKSVVAVTVNDGQASVQNVTLFGLGTINLNVTTASGAPVTDAIVYITSASRGTELVAGRTNAQGGLVIANVPTGEYTIRVRDPRVPADYVYQATADPFFQRTIAGVLSNNGETKTVTIAMRVMTSLHVTVRDVDLSQPLVNATVYVIDARGSRIAGTTDALGRVLAQAIPEGPFEFVVHPRADTYWRRVHTTGVVTTADDGSTVPVGLPISQMIDQTGALTFEGERRIYEVVVKAGDNFTVNFVGETRSPAAALPSAAIAIYDSQGLLVSSGAIGQNVSVFSAPPSVDATYAGPYTIAVQAHETGLRALGAYRLSVDVNGFAGTVSPWLGANVTGRVLRASGGAASGRLVEVTSSQPLSLRVRVVTNSDGVYSYGGVPTGSTSVKVISERGSVLSGKTVNVPGASSVTAEDISLPSMTTLTLVVRLSDGTPAPLGTYIDLFDDLGGRHLSTDVNGVITAEVVGPFNAFAQTPTLPGEILSRWSVPIVDGIAQSLTLDFAPAVGRVSGQVYKFGGIPITGQSDVGVDLFAHANGYWRFAWTDYWTGRFAVTNFEAYDTPIEIRAYDRTVERYSQPILVTVPAGSSVTGVALTLGPVATFGGYVLDIADEPASGATVCADYDDGLNLYHDGVSRPIRKCADSNADGLYTFPALPAGVPFTLQAKRGPLSSLPRFVMIPEGLSSDSTQPLRLLPPVSSANEGQLPKVPVGKAQAPSSDLKAQRLRVGTDALPPKPNVVARNLEVHP